MDKSLNRFFSFAERQALRPRPFEYSAPTSITEAVNLLHSSEEAKILAGGQSLVTLMKLRLASAKLLIDINRIPELSQIRREGDMIVVGAVTRHDQLAHSNLMRETCPLISEAAAQIADQQVRNRGTIGGSLAHADPTADLPAACTAAQARVVTTSHRGSRSIELADLFRGYYETSLERDEMIREVRIPVPPERSGSAYMKFSKGHDDFAIVGVASLLTFDSARVCKAANVVLGAVASTPVHAKDTENFLMGKRTNDEVIEEASAKASDDIRPPSDARASAEYRLKMVKVLAKRALKISTNRALGND
jgi:carbon-monoxide dehydrogenase medium subunit